MAEPRLALHLLAFTLLTLFALGCGPDTHPDNPPADDSADENTRSVAEPQVPPILSSVWTPAAPMGAPRWHHSATRLWSGQVLIVGGDDGSSLLASVEIYDPMNDSWAPAAPMSTARSWHQAVLLPSGRVLVAGGIGSLGVLATAEIYDPSSNTWVGAAPMQSPRVGHSATLMTRALGDQVLVAGGGNGPATTSAERYDPPSDTWTPAAPMASARTTHSATLLSNGQVLVVGGKNGAALGSSELYNPLTDTWSPAGALAQARAQHGVVRLRDGKLLVVGGEAGGALSSAERYDPATKLWSPAGALAQARSGASVVALPYDRMVALGGDNKGIFAGTETYNPATNGWSPSPPMSAARSGHSATLLSNGKVLVVGGAGASGVLASAELYDGPLPLGEPCTTELQCESGFCADGVCCDSQCPPSGCSACAVSKGASANGVCTAVDHPTQCRLLGACADLAPDTQCNGVSCVNARKRNCYQGGSCYSSHCDNELGCVYLSQPNGIPCPDKSFEYACFSENAICYDAWPKPRPVPAPHGGPCKATSECSSGACVDGICISASCSTEPCWRPTGPILLNRTGQAASLLPSGKLSVRGGMDHLASSPVVSWDGITYFDSIITFTPGVNVWDGTDNTTQFYRGAYAASLVLANGDELYTGGEYSSGSDLDYGAIDKRASAFRAGVAVHPMWAARSHHSMTLLPSGEALVVGGSPVLDVERYQPATNTWLPGPSLITPRTGHSATLLPSGKVLVAGGGTATAEIYDWATETWTPAAPMSVSRGDHSATLLLDGKVLVAGGGANGSAELYNPATNTWSPAAPMSEPHAQHSALRLSNGEVVVVGPGTAVERYDPAANTWTSLPPMAVPRSWPTLLELPDGRLLAAFGATSEVAQWASLSSEIFGVGAPIAAPCNKDIDCQSGFCADGLCCDSACNGGPCDACSVAAGAAVDGSCVPFSGVACDDGNACTSNDTCQSGVCVGTNSVSCPAAVDACHGPGICKPETGACFNPKKPDGTPCDDGNPQTKIDSCYKGVCSEAGDSSSSGSPSDSPAPPAFTSCGCAFPGSVEGSTPWLSLVLLGLLRRRRSPSRQGALQG